MLFSNTLFWTVLLNQDRELCVVFRIYDSLLVYSMCILLGPSGIPVLLCKAHLYFPCKSHINFIEHPALLIYVGILAYQLSCDPSVPCIFVYHYLYHIYWYYLVTWFHAYWYIDRNNYFPWSRNSCLSSLYTQPLSILPGKHKAFKNVFRVNDEWVNILPQNCLHGQR